MAIDTKERILDVGERLFADRGFPATSLRDITHEAGVNIASVNYHFGSKEALLGAVLERRLRPLNARRLELLDAVESAAGDRPPSAEDVIARFSPRRSRSGRSGAQAATTSSGSWDGCTRKRTRRFAPPSLSSSSRSTVASGEALQRARPELDAADIGWRMLFLVGAMAFAMAWGDSFASIGPGSHRDPEDVLESLIQYAAAGMESPVPVGVSVGTAWKGRAS